MAQPQQKKLFEPLIIRKKVLKNRIFSTGHMAVMLNDGCPTDSMVAYHEAKAKGVDVQTLWLPGDHYSIIDVASDDWLSQIEAIKDWL